MIFRLIWIKTDVRLNPNQTENRKHNLISGGFNKISLCAAKQLSERLPYFRIIEVQLRVPSNLSKISVLMYYGV